MNIVKASSLYCFCRYRDRQVPDLTQVHLPLWVCCLLLLLPWKLSGVLVYELLNVLDEMRSLKWFLESQKHPDIARHNGEAKEGLQDTKCP